MSKSLEELRIEIDRIDSGLLGLLRERMALMPEVARVKVSAGMPVFQPGRESALIEAKRKLALEFGLSPDFVEKVFRLLMQEAKQIQQRELEK